MGDMVLAFKRKGKPYSIRIRLPIVPEPSLSCWEPNAVACGVELMVNIMLGLAVIYKRDPGRV